MSDFSSGILMNESFKELAKQYSEENTYLIKLDDGWLCRLSENDFCEMVAENYSEAVLNLSVQIPLLHIISAEDHGFELCILFHKKVVFHFQVNYGAENEFAFHIGTELYGDEYMDVVLDSKVQAHINNEVLRRYPEVEETIASYFSEINQEGIEQFKLFGFDNEICNKIQNLLTVNNYNKDKRGHQMINELLSVLKLSRFSFVSYNYVNPDEGIFEILE